MDSTQFLAALGKFADTLCADKEDHDGDTRSELEIFGAYMAQIKEWMKNKDSSFDKWNAVTCVAGVYHYYVTNEHGHWWSPHRHQARVFFSVDEIIGPGKVAPNGSCGVSAWKV